MGLGGDHVGNNDAPPLNYMDVYRPSTGKSNTPNNENVRRHTEYKCRGEIYPDTSSAVVRI